MSLFANPKGELRICPKCNREHDILRGTRCWCACGQEIRSKQYTPKSQKENSQVETKGEALRSTSRNKSDSMSCSDNKIKRGWGRTYGY